MDEVIKQIQLLAQTVQAMISRQEQLFKMQEERLMALPRIAEALQGTKDNLEVTNEALQRSLSDADQQIDDVAAIVAALLQVQQQQQQGQAQGE